MSSAPAYPARSSSQKRRSYLHGVGTHSIQDRSNLQRIRRLTCCTAGGYKRAPGIWNREQIAAWKEVVDAVHAKGSFVYIQLWALGRVADQRILEAEGFKLQSASAVPVSEGKPVPEAMSEGDIEALIKDYANAAQNAMEAGFDGVEIHGVSSIIGDLREETEPLDRS